MPDIAFFLREPHTKSPDEDLLFPCELKDKVYLYVKKDPSLNHSPATHCKFPPVRKQCPELTHTASLAMPCQDSRYVSGRVNATADIQFSLPDILSTH